MNLVICGANLKRAREIKGYSPHDVELAKGINPSRLSRIENGTADSVRLIEILDLLELYETSASWTLQDIGHMSLDHTKDEFELLENFNELSDKNKQIILLILKLFIS